MTNRPCVALLHPPGPAASGELFVRIGHRKGPGPQKNF